jgi:uncharacterized protein (UPF0261 family)
MEDHMAKTAVIVGSFDTKGKEFDFIRQILESQGLQSLTVDFGVMGDPEFPVDIPRSAVAQAGGGDLSLLASGHHKDEAMRVMGAGLEAVVRQLYAEGRLDGIIAMGGSGNTSIATRGMRALPVGVPKVMVSTLGGGDVSAYTGTKDIVFFPSIVDVAGINLISREIYANAAGALAGMLLTERPPAPAEEKPLVVASMFGNTTKAVDHARQILEREGYEVLVFHATGTGGRVMESLIMDGYIRASLDITTTELADYVCGGVLSAGSERGLAASRRGIPAVIVPGCVDMANFWGIDTVPEKYKDRQLYQWNPNVTLMRTNIEENTRIGELIAAAANAASAPVAILLPLRGVSMLDSEGEMFWDPAADQACYQAIQRNVKPGIPVIEVDHNINDPEFAEMAALTLLKMLDTPV